MTACSVLHVNYPDCSFVSYPTNKSLCACCGAGTTRCEVATRRERARAGAEKAEMADDMSYLGTTAMVLAAALMGYVAYNVTRYALLWYGMASLDQRCFFVRLEYAVFSRVEGQKMLCCLSRVIRRTLSNE
jgi:hypothetical protein